MNRSACFASLIVTFVTVLTASARDEVSAGHVPDSGTIAIRCGVLVDGVRDEAQQDRVVEIANGRIVAVVEGDSYDGDVMDLSGSTCLPGLLDTHTHLAEPGPVDDLSIFYTISPAEIRDASRKNALITLRAGFTTVRNLGAYIGWSARDMRDRINRGEYPGPRVQAAGFYLTVPAGGGDLVIPGHAESDIPDVIRLGVSRGADEFRRHAQQAVDGGADVLKVIASGAVLAYGGVPGAPEMTREELTAVAEVAHAAGIRMTAHAHGAQSIKDAIRAGADSIEHASLADDEAIALAAEQQVAFSMDVYNGDYIATEGVASGWPEEFIRKNNETTEAQRQVFTKAYKAGVPITFGTDSGVYPHGQNARQFSIMVQRGMSPMDAIKAATSVAARHIGWGDDVGQLTPGHFGDLIAVENNPLDDISALENVAVVIKGGLVFKNQ